MNKKKLDKIKEKSLTIITTATVITNLYRFGGRYGVISIKDFKL